VDWYANYRALTDGDREELARVVSLLLEQTFLVRDQWDPKEQRLRGNRDYRFLERNLPLVREYLAVAGFELQVDGRAGVMAVYNRYGRNRMKVDKYTTYLLYTLRLIYEEQMESASMRREVVVSLQDILGKMYSLGLVDRRLAVTQLTTAINRLRKLCILARIEGTPQEPESRWLIYPTITIAVSNERINNLYERLSAGEFAADALVDQSSGEASDETTDDMGDDVGHLDDADDAEDELEEDGQ
jgi:hypothetical protein